MADSSLLETFDNPKPEREYLIEHIAPEFTSICPKTGNPDFATITVSYIPDKKCVELKSLKIYLNSYRNVGAFYESLVNKILDDLVEVTEPKWMEVKGEFNVRGGIASEVTAEYTK